MNLHHVMYMHVKNVQIAGQDFIVLEDVQPMHATGSVKGVYKEGCELFCKRLECALAVAIIRDMKENSHENADC